MTGTKALKRLPAQSGKYKHSALTMTKTIPHQKWVWRSKSMKVTWQNLSQMGHVWLLSLSARIIESGNILSWKGTTRFI